MAKRRGTAKRDEIVSAFIDTVEISGLEAASMGEVAARLGLDRTTVHYYFRTRDDLILASINQITKTYVTMMEARIEKFDPRNRVNDMLDFLFGDFHQPKLSRVIGEFMNSGQRTPVLRRKVAAIYRAIETIIVNEIAAGFPEAPLKLVQDIGYAVAQLSEGFTVFIFLGFGADRRRAARRAANCLISELSKPTASEARRSAATGAKRPVDGSLV